jgi:CheY-like chemotaxis protein
MEAVAHLLNGLAAVLWPVIVLVVLMRLAPVLSAIAESAKERGFTVEIAGQKLSMQELTRQQGDTIGDLLAQVAALRNEVDAHSAPLAATTYSPVTRTNLQPDSGTELPSPAKDTRSQNTNAGRQVTNASSARTVPGGTPISSVIGGALPRRILWVDDNPKNNSYLISQLQNLGITIDQVTSTREAVAAFASSDYGAVISDMGRKEGDAYNVTAGADVTRVLRTQSPEVPIIIYCAAKAAQRYGVDAFTAGANAVTASATELLSLLGIERRTPAA